MKTGLLLRDRGQDGVELVLEARKQRPEAWRELFERCESEMVRFCRRFMGPRDPLRRLYQSQDIVQEAFATAMRKIESLENDASFYAWVRTIIRHKIAVKRRDELTNRHFRKVVRLMKYLKQERGSFNGVRSVVLTTLLGQQVTELRQLFYIGEEHRVGITSNVEASAEIAHGRIAAGVPPDREQQRHRHGGRRRVHRERQGERGGGQDAAEGVSDELVEDDLGAHEVAVGGLELVLADHRREDDLGRVVEQHLREPQKERREVQQRQRHEVELHEDGDAADDEAA